MPDQRALLKKLRAELVGIDMKVPTMSGTARQYVNLDNASSTPTFRPVVEKVDEFMRYYSNVGRGTGFKSGIASWAYEESRRTIGRFLGTDPQTDTIIFTRNTTESMNRLAALFPFRPDSVVLTTMMEHHSNDLPWRRRARVVRVGLKPDGSLDLDDFAARLNELRGKVALVAVTGASNVTGWVNPIHQLARLAHEAGARIAIDAAQIAPHRPINMRKPDDPEHLDFVAFSEHKTYAPYGVGVLAGNSAILHASEPALVGGGVVDLVTLDSVVWRDLPEREEAGTPDIVGVVALASAIRLLEAVGWDAVLAHEEQLTRYLLKRLTEIPGVTIYGQNDAGNVGERLGVVAFNVDSIHHALVAAILSYEFAIGVRSGCFCAHPYMLCLLGVGPEEAEKVRGEIVGRNRTNVPGAVRASVGIYNDESDIDALIEALKVIQRGDQTGKYVMCKETGSYVPTGQDCFDFEHHFTLDPRLPR